MCACPPQKYHISLRKLAKMNKQVGGGDFPSLAGTFPALLPAVPRCL